MDDALPDTSTAGGAGNSGIAPELQNLAIELTQEESEAIAALCLREYESDLAGRKSWEEMHARWINMFYQQDRPRNPPWQGSSEESVPLLAEACTQFHSRAFKAMFPNRTFIKAVPTGNIEKKDIDRADRVGKHLSWQLLTRDKTYKPGKDALLMQLPLHGCAFTKTYFDPMLGRPTVENVRAEDLVLPYAIGAHDIESMERKTHVMMLSLNKTRILAESGYFARPAEPFMVGSDESRPTTEAIDRASGQTPGTLDNSGAQRIWAKIIEQHRLLDLDGDGIEEPYIVTVDCQSRKLLRVSIRYETDPSGRPLAGKAPIEYFTQYDFLPNPDGTYGLGMGHLLGKINSAVNKLLRQTIDAGTLANSKSGFVSSALDLKKGEVQLQMGKFMPVNPGGGKLADNFMPLDFGGPDQSIIAIMDMMMKYGERLGFVTENLTGSSEKVMQPTAVLALIEQGLQVFSSVYERVVDSWGRELAKIYRLNSLYMPEKEYVTVQGLGGLARVEIARADYAEDLQIEPVADPKLATDQQKMARAQAEWDFLSQNPLVLASPPHFYRASRRFLEAMGVIMIDEVLPVPLGEAQRVDDPNIENMGAMLPQPMVPPAHPGQDHVTHIQAHQAFLNDPQYGQFITPQGGAAMQLHIQHHVALMYGMTESSMPMSLGGEDGGLPGAGSGATMAPAPGYVMVPPLLGGASGAGGGMAPGGQPGGNGAGTRPGQGSGNGQGTASGSPAKPGMTMQ